jgi:hypothetical protein
MHAHIVESVSYGGMLLQCTSGYMIKHIRIPANSVLNGSSHGGTLRFTGGSMVQPATGATSAKKTLVIRTV